MATKTVAAVTLKNDPMIARRDRAGAPRTRPCTKATRAGALVSLPQVGVAIVHLAGKLNELALDLAGGDDDNGLLAERKHR